MLSFFRLTVQNYLFLFLKISIRVWVTGCLLQLVLKMLQKMSALVFVFYLFLKKWKTFCFLAKIKAEFLESVSPSNEQTSSVNNNLCYIFVGKHLNMTWPGCSTNTPSANPWNVFRSYQFSLFPVRVTRVPWYLRLKVFHQVLFSIADRELEREHFRKLWILNWNFWLLFCVFHW